MGAKQPGPADIRKKLYHFCAYQERSHRQAREKLYALNLNTEMVEETMAHLITEGFLNEERFARAFAGGKFRMKQWGRLKIIQALKREGVSEKNIKIGLSEIDESTYRSTLERVIQKKLDASTKTDELIVRDQAARFAMGKGYEPDFVWEVIRALNR